MSEYYEFALYRDLREKIGEGPRPEPWYKEQKRRMMHGVICNYVRRQYGGLVRATREWGGAELKVEASIELLFDDSTPNKDMINAAVGSLVADLRGQVGKLEMATGIGD